MKLAVYSLALLLIIGGVVCGAAAVAARESGAQQEAIAGTVSGGMIQKVGFRAMIQKQAIMYDLAGYARNNADGTVGLSLQGDKKRIDKALEAIRAGTKRSSRDITINASAASVDPHLNTFTVFGWTSTSRNITNPYDLVFHLRPTDEQISKKDAEAAWNSIAQSTLKGDDLTKFKNHLGGEE
ncbi:MAG TPA: acylphosphatase [Roseiarcus sp.]|jgi:acylphosphatase